MLGNRDIQKKTSAITLSDMEMFIFPELMYSLVLANIMSPRIWLWRDDPWFAGLERMKPRRRVARLKQFIMDHYAFNLDLDTWGLTTKAAEISRFKDFIDEDTLARANALFGYEGDKYYFDIDIRTHFGLDKYEGDIIPYWKTETVEAMDAFCHKPNYTTGAGECVSLAALYAAALFIVARIPLKDIYLMATPLHSQNYIDVGDGVLTNNRRLVTKSMWCNGSAISGQARRALENERVTIVAHETGVVHTIYDAATIDRGAYDHFCSRLKSFLKTELSEESLGNFLRHDHSIQKCFQLRCQFNGLDHYIGVEQLMAYEHGSPYRVTDNTREKLLDEIDREVFVRSPLKSRIILNDLEAFVVENKIDIYSEDGIRKLTEQFASDCLNAEIAIASLMRFCHVEPRLPDAGAKQFGSDQDPLNIDPDMSRDEIIERLEGIRESNVMAEMSFYAYRDLSRIEPEPYIKACVERNPVSVEASREMDDDALLEFVQAMPSESIYDEEGRLAQPDEVWNYGRGDGLEKAVLMANVLRSRLDGEMTIEVGDGAAVLRAGERVIEFATGKRPRPGVWSV